jgi:hypothetical protein
MDREFSVAFILWAYKDVVSITSLFLKTCTSAKGQPLIAAA